MVSGVSGYVDNPIIFIIIVSLISAISEWIGKRRRAAAEARGESVPPLEGEIEVESDPRLAPEAKGKPRAPAPEDDWEDRLRRLLEGDELPSRSQNREARTPEESFPQEAPYSEPPPVPVTPVPVPPVVKIETVSTPRAVTEAKSFIEPAPKPEDEGLGVGAPVQVSRRAGGGVRHLAKFGSRRAIRQAIVTAVVLGPPKATEENADLIKL